MSIVWDGLVVNEHIDGEGTHQRAPVRVATVTAGTMATSFENGDTVDGVVLVTGDRILIKDQATADNGVYIVQASGIPIRDVDLEIGENANGFTTFVKEGTVNEVKIFVCVSVVGSDVVGTDTLTFSQADVIGTLDVTRGGTGLTNLTSGNVLVGAGTSAVTTTKVAPTGDFVGTTDAQTLTNKGFIDDDLTITGVTGTDRDLIFDPSTTAADGTSTTLRTTQTTDIIVSFPDTTGTLATIAEVQALVQNIDWKESVRLSSTDALNDNASISGAITYNSTGGTSGRGQITATLSISDTFTIDSVSLGAANDGTRILLKNENDTATSPDGARNGIWATTIVGTSLTLDRTEDFDEDAEVTANANIFVSEGTTLSDTGWTLITNDPIIIGGVSGTVLEFTQFTSIGSVTAGDGLQKVGNVISVDEKANGGLVIESGELAVDLGATNITGTLAVSDGGTSVTTFGGVNTLLYTTAADTLTSITTANNSVLITDGSGAPSWGTTLPSQLTIPSAIIDQILDANLNELLVFNTTASAVNHLSITNAATGTAPCLTAEGDDANIDLCFQAKGTGIYDFNATSATAAEIRLSEDTDNGTNYVGIAAPDVTTSYTLTLPVAAGSAGQVLRSVDAAGTLEFATIATSTATITFSMPFRATVNKTTYTTIGYMTWYHADFSGFTNGRLIFEVDQTTNRSVDIRVRNVTASVNIVEQTGIAVDSFVKTTGFTNPAADARLELQVKKSANGGINPFVYGASISWDE